VLDPLALFVRVLFRFFRHRSLQMSASINRQPG
jgi:hypothetical protein